MTGQTRSDKSESLNSIGFVLSYVFAIHVYLWGLARLLSAYYHWSEDHRWVKSSIARTRTVYGISFSWELIRTRIVYKHTFS